MKKGKNISCVIYPWDNVPGGSFPRGNYVGDKSSEKQFSSEAICRGILSRGNYLWGNFLRAIIQGVIIRRQFSSGAIFLVGSYSQGQFSVGQLSGGQFSSGAFKIPHS